MLPYSAEVLASFLGRYNAALWPAQPLVYLLTGLALVQLWRGWPPGDRLLAAGLAVAWAWVAWGYFAQGLAQLDFLAPAYAAAFALQALLLLAAGFWRDGLDMRLRPNRPIHPDRLGRLGLALIFLALAWPLLAAALPQSDWTQAPVVWLAPGPSVVATLGFLLLARRPSRVLLVVPLLWALTFGAVGWLLGLPLTLAAAALSGAGLAALVWGRRRGGRAPGGSPGATGR